MLARLFKEGSPPPLEACVFVLILQGAISPDVHLRLVPTRVGDHMRFPDRLNCPDVALLLLSPIFR